MWWEETEATGKLALMFLPEMEALVILAEEGEPAAGAATLAKHTDRAVAVHITVRRVRVARAHLVS